MNRILSRATALGLLLTASGALAQAIEPAPAMGRYMPLYPGMYGELGWATDPRDGSYDQHGRRRASATPQSGDGTAFPIDTTTARFTWHFPMFESQKIPFFSSRTHLARVTLSHSTTETTGPLAAFVADDSDDARTEADDLVNSGRGLGDTLLEFGSFLAGSPTPDWRTRERAPFALVALIGVNVPTGVYERDAPNSPGSNTWFVQGRLGLHWQPWNGGFLDVGGAYRDYLVNEEPMFGDNAPWRQGDDTLFDLSFVQRALPGLYLGAYVTRQKGRPNRYLSPVYAANAPPHPDSDTDAYPVPGLYEDRGTELKVAGFTARYFITQRWLAALSFEQPKKGRSGQFELPYNQKSPSGCIPGATTCNTSSYETILADGMGPARKFTSDRWQLSVTYNFGLGDVYPCTGCEE